MRYNGNALILELSFSEQPPAPVLAELEQQPDRYQMVEESADAIMLRLYYDH